ncbi:MAG: hypothetical protein ACREFQ_21095 [Stellaceae bacterium]
MTPLKAILRELAGLFVEDGTFALQVVAIIAGAALSAWFAPGVPLLSGSILLAGSLGVVVANAARARKA